MDKMVEKNLKMSEKPLGKSIDILMQGRKKPKKYLSKGETVGVVAGSFAAGVLTAGLTIYAIGSRAKKR